MRKSIVCHGCCYGAATKSTSVLERIFGDRGAKTGLSKLRMEMRCQGLRGSGFFFFQIWDELLVQNAS